MRPELHTPTLARVVAPRARARIQEAAQIGSRLALFPNYEKQQRRGRLREHFQLNCDITGEASLCRRHRVGGALCIDILQSDLGSPKQTLSCPDQRPRFLDRISRAKEMASPGPDGTSLPGRQIDNPDVNRAKRNDSGETWRIPPDPIFSIPRDRRERAGSSTNLLMAFAERGLCCRLRGRRSMSALCADWLITPEAHSYLRRSICGGKSQRRRGRWWAVVRQL